MKRDRIMRKLIPKFGDLYLIGRDDPFTTLTRSIIAQQLTGQAADILWQKFLTVCPKSTPAQVLRAGSEKLLGCGLSKRKLEYVVDLAEHFKGDRLHVDRWASMTDDEVILELTQIRGIGRWTAEMFLIFNLLRPNILPLDDQGLIRATSINYFSGEPVSRSELREVAANWEPWRTVATWYLWRSLD
ncbi:MAG: DNA-3-methyladenine glycosylase 2 family protein [Burkholderiaceae bacterium]|nr:DNA-3-methyladenine glycosylase 2 family protein [Burkholderiaceae bacterium]